MQKDFEGSVKHYFAYSQMLVSFQWWSCSRHFLENFELQIKRAIIIQVFVACWDETYHQKRNLESEVDFTSDLQ